MEHTGRFDEGSIACVGQVSAKEPRGDNVVVLPGYVIREETDREFLLP